MPANNSDETMDFYLAQICHLHYIRVRQLLEALGLYRGQPGVLRVLWKQEGITQTEMAARLRNSPATITKMLQRMEKSGFISRKVDSVDQRVSRVYLTDAGRAIQNQVEKVWETMEAETFAGIKAEEKVKLRRFLLQMRSNLLEATGEEPWK
jgi:MarR family transcriptional regulator, organic hydroperoxide resistance regulator